MRWRNRNYNRRLCFLAGCLLVININKKGEGVKLQGDERLVLTSLSGFWYSIFSHKQGEKCRGAWEARNKKILKPLSFCLTDTRRLWYYFVLFFRLRTAFKGSSGLMGWRKSWDVRDRGQTAWQLRRAGWKGSPEEKSEAEKKMKKSSWHIRHHLVTFRPRCTLKGRKSLKVKNLQCA